MQETWRVAIGCVVCAGLLQVSEAQARDVLVSSRFSNSIIRYDDAGGLVGVFSAGPELLNPNGIAYGPDGNLYVGLGDVGSILRYDGATGAFIGTFVASGVGGLANVRDIAFGPDGNLYANSGTTRQVLRYDGSTGAFLGVAGQGGGLNGPVGLTFGPDGSMYVGAALSNRIYRFSPAGTLLRTYVPGVMSNATGVAIGPDGMLYAAMSVTNVVARFDPETGALLGTFGAGTGLNIPIYMNLTPGGDLLVGSFGNDSVLRYDPITGASRGVFIASGLGGLDGTHDMVYMPVPGPSGVALAGAAVVLGIGRRRR
jgi:streptogramin lyase